MYTFKTLVWKKPLFNNCYTLSHVSSDVYIDARNHKSFYILYMHIPKTHSNARYAVILLRTRGLGGTRVGVVTLGLPSGWRQLVAA